MGRGDFTTVKSHFACAGASPPGVDVHADHVSRHWETRTRVRSTLGAHVGSEGRIPLRCPPRTRTPTEGVGASIGPRRARCAVLCVWGEALRCERPPASGRHPRGGACALAWSRPSVDPAVGQVGQLGHASPALPRKFETSLFLRGVVEGLQDGRDRRREGTAGGKDHARPWPP